MQHLDLRKWKNKAKFILQFLYSWMSLPIIKILFRGKPIRVEVFQSVKAVVLTISATQKGVGLGAAV